MLALLLPLLGQQSDQASAKELLLSVQVQLVQRDKERQLARAAKTTATGRYVHLTFV